MNIKKLLRSEQKTIGKATGVIAIFIMLSRLLGLVRDRLLASTFGASVDLDIYFAAFKIPDFIYSMILAGGVLVALLPIFSDYYSKNKEQAWGLINNIINAFLLILAVISLFFIIFTSQIINLILPGLDPSYLNEAIMLTRIIFFGVFFFGLSSIFSSILNYFNRFLIYSLAPILYNIGIILGIVFLAPIWGIYGVAFGVLIGAFLHFFIQFLASKSYGYKYKLVLDFRFKGLKEFFTLIFPRAIAAAASQFNFIIITAIASTIAIGAISIFNFANNLRFLPVGFIGISFATALFPHLSKSATEDKKEEFKLNFKKVFKTVLYISFPVGVLTFIMRDLIVKTVLESGAFTGYAVEITGACLGVFALSLFLQCLEPILLRGFFSIKDTRTPTIIALIFLAINTIFSFGFVYLLKMSSVLSGYIINLFNLNSLSEVLLLGLTFAFSISLVIEYLLLYIFLKRKIGDFGSKEIWKMFVQIALISIIMSIVAIFSLNIINLGTGFLMYLTTFVIITLISFLIYFSLSMLFKIEEAQTIKRYIFKN